MKFTDDEINLLIKLRKEGYIGQRLCNKFNKKFSSERKCLSIRNKLYNLREEGVILR